MQGEMTELQMLWAAKRPFCGFSAVLIDPEHNDAVVIGGMRCPQSIEELDEVISKYNIGLVVSMTEKELEFMAEFNQTYAGTARIAHIPVDDYATPAHKQCQDFVAQATTHRQQALTAGSTLRPGIAVHCHQGMGRTGTFLALYLIARAGYSPVEAVKHVRDKRPGSITTLQERFLLDLTL